MWYCTHTPSRVADEALLAGLEVRVDIQGQTLRAGGDTVHLRVPAGAGLRPYGEAAVMAIYLREYVRAGVVDYSMWLLGNEPAFETALQDPQDNLYDG